MSTSTEPEAAVPARSVTADLRSAARGGLFTVAGAATSTAMGFVLTMLLAHELGAAGAGVVQQAIAAATIALALARLGMDTTAVWLLPRLRRQDPASVRGACTTIVGLSALGGALVTAAWLGLDALSGRPLLGDVRVDQAFTAVAWALPFGAVMLTALAATRGFGNVVPFNLIGNIAVPGLRPVVVGLVCLMGGSAVAAAWGWAVVLPPAAALAVLVLARRVRAEEQRRDDGSGSWRSTGALRRQVLGFGLPRTVSTMLEQSLAWLDVILVGILLGPAAAGIYGVASRFVAGGQVVMTALRIVVAPQFSARLAMGEKAEAQHLYAVTSTWIVVCGAPVYLLLACFAPSILALPGGEFVEGDGAMVVLCLGGLALLSGGNIQSLLLMTGRSGWALVDKLVVVTVSVTGNLVLIPVWGITGAAATSSACWALDGLLAAVQVRRFTGISPSLRRIGGGLALAFAVTASAALAGLALSGQSLTGLAVAAALTALGMLGAAYAARGPLHLDELSGLLRRRGGTRLSEREPRS